MLYSFFIYTVKSSHPEVFFKKDALRRFRHFSRRRFTKKCCFKFIEIILLHGYSSVNMLYICKRTPFLENLSLELLLHIVLNIEVINAQVLSKQVKKLFVLTVNALSTFLIFYVTSAWCPKDQYTEAVVIVHKTRKRE